MFYCFIWKFILAATGIAKVTVHLSFCSLTKGYLEHLQTVLYCSIKKKKYSSEPFLTHDLLPVQRLTAASLSLTAMERHWVWSSACSTASSTGPSTYTNSPSDI